MEDRHSQGERMRKNESGFSIVELLLVLMVIGIIVAIAIPNLLASRRAANEASAISALRTFHSAQATYSSTAGAGTYGTSAQLGSLQLVDVVLGVSAPSKSGYAFTINVSTAAPARTQYCAVASPITAPPAINRSGERWFGVSVPGVVFSTATAGALTCDPATGILSGGNPIM